MYVCCTDSKKNMQKGSFEGMKAGQAVCKVHIQVLHLFVFLKMRLGETPRWLDPYYVINITQRVTF